MFDTITLRPGYEKPASSAFPEDWTVSRLDELCTFHQGGKLGITKSSGYVTSGAPAYSAAGQDGYVGRVEFSNTDGVVLSAIGANCGRCFFASGDWTTLANVQAIIPSPSKLDAKYLYYRVNRESYWPRSGSAQPFIKPSDVRSCWVAHPPIRQQKLIAHILDTLDTQVQKTEALIAKLEKVKEGLLHDLLTRGIDENGRLRPSPEQAPELYKESPLGLIPREWVPSSGAQACKEIVVGIVIKPTQYYRASGVPILRSANVRENRLSLDNLMYMSQQDHKAMSKSSVSPGDVLTVRTGYPGTSCVVDGSLEEANCVDIIISRVGEGLDPNFWALWINSDFGKGHVLKSQGGLAQQHFNVGDLKKIQLPIPAMPEQLKIVGTWGALQEQIQKESTRLEKLQLQKTGLMDDLLTGRVRVTPLLDQAQAQAQAQATTPA